MLGDFRLDASKAIRKVLRQNNITITYFSDYDRFPSNEYIQETLVETQTEGRSQYYFRCFAFHILNK